jgi:hypothetical protein
MTTSTPYCLRAYHGWSDHDPLILRYATLDGAYTGARLLDRADYPLVDLSLSGRGVMATRRLVAHPFDRDFLPHDDFGGDS